MSKFLAVVKREYVQRVRTKMFIVATILGPLVMSLFGVIPALILSIPAGWRWRTSVSVNCAPPPQLWVCAKSQSSTTRISNLTKPRPPRLSQALRDT